ncbi:hypothetical protein Tco_0966608 [Tanacetum coccineum]
MDEEIEKLVERTENAETFEDDSSTLRQNDNKIDPNTRLESRSDKESPERSRSSLKDFRLLILLVDLLPFAQEIRTILMMMLIFRGRIENSAKRQKTSEHGTFVSGESLSGQDYESGLGPSTSCNQEQSDDFDFWMDSYATDDDELPTEKVSQELVDEMLKSVDEAKLRKVNDVLWERRKEILVSPYPQRPTPVVQSCLSYPKAPALSLVNQDLLYLKKGSSGPKKIVMSLHKFPATYWELGHEYKLITEIVARRANGSIVSITESDYKNLNKNDIEDMYLLMVHGKLGVESYQHKVNLTAPTITFPGIEKFKVFSIISEPVYGIIYKNNQKEKRVMRHQEIHKFYDATLKRVLEGLKRYNHDVKHGYVTPSLSKEDSKYMQLFEEEIEERLRHRDQMRRWERQLGSRRERLPTDLRLSYLSVTKSTRPPHATDEDSEREEENAFFLARSRPIGRTSHTSSPEPSASSFKFKPPCIEPKTVSGKVTEGETSRHKKYKS